MICSPQAAKSRWVNEEIIAFKRLGREDRIFCLIVDGEPNATDLPGRAEEECFPPALRFRLGADGQLSEIRTEPIAADAREGKDGRRSAKLKLIAGVLGVGYDALRRREQQRRNRRLFALTCAALARHGGDQRSGRVCPDAAHSRPQTDRARGGGSGDREADHQVPG